MYILKDKLVELKLKGHSCDDCYYDRYDRYKYICIYSRLIDKPNSSYKSFNDNICSNWVKEGQLL